jgi:transmembrane sensor
MTDKMVPIRTAQRIAEAVAWHTSLRESDLLTTPEFEDWLKDPENAHVWSQTIAVWDFVGDQANEPEVVAARMTALGAVKRAIARRSTLWDWRRPALAVAAAFLVMMGGVEGYRWVQRPADYTTGIGERRTIRLEDGSRVSLDSESEVTVRYTYHARELHLIKGQARFDVAHDVKRPFSVIAKDQKVVATGTSFNIDLTRPDVAVTLIEGHVVVFNAKADTETNPLHQPGQKAHQVELHAGQQLVAAENHAPLIKVANMPQVTAWVTGQMLFSNESLSGVVARVNRYSATPIIIADPDIAAAHVSGVFNAGDVSGFLDMVTQMLPLEVSNDEPGRIVLKKRQS